MARLLWGHDRPFIDRLSLDASERFILAVANRGEAGAAMQLFDPRTLAAAGPRIGLSDALCGYGCLAETPDGPAAVEVAGDRIRLWDPLTGSLLAETAVRFAFDPFEPVLDAATLSADGRTLLVVYGVSPDHYRTAEWQVFDLHTGRRRPRCGDTHSVEPDHVARIGTAGDLITVTAQEGYIEDDPGDPAGAYAAVKRLAYVYRLPGGERCGSVELNGRDETATATVAGRRFLGSTGYPSAVYELPSLTVTAELSGAHSQIALGALAGRPVAVAETRPSSGDHLGLWYLDRPGKRAASITVPPLRDPLARVSDLALTDDGTLVVATSQGLWAVPAEELGWLG